MAVFCDSPALGSKHTLGKVQGHSCAPKLALGQDRRRAISLLPLRKLEIPEIYEQLDVGHGAPAFPRWLLATTQQTKTKEGLLIASPREIKAHSYMERARDKGHQLFGGGWYGRIDRATRRVCQAESTTKTIFCPLGVGQS